MQLDLCIAFRGVAAVAVRLHLSTGRGRYTAQNKPQASVGGNIVTLARSTIAHSAGNSSGKWHIERRGVGGLHVLL
jgi:hypothetical protein